MLDVGCGTGAKACELAGHVKQIYGIDISSKVIEIAESRAQDLRVANVSFEKATLFEEGFEEGAFDIVLAMNVLHGLDETQTAVKRRIYWKRSDLKTMVWRHAE